ncbi:hypothetical protein RJ640_017033 [Escallonia rubra]|uniref:Uncharacterized protein n=1 Tax=Escallonia rubra TaxID=112253 RepID=A0AA88R6L2_9ASTE|nr:hypothetical protein RJ640_017033 [Escallonia rubra]
MEEGVELEETLKVVEASLSLCKWRLKASSKRRLETDMLALCTGMRAVIMVDYGGKMPELRERLCSFLKFSQKESTIFEFLRVMVIEDMVYLIHVKGLAELVKSSLNSELKLYFVDIEQDPPKMITEAEKSSLGRQLISVQKLFSSVFLGDLTGTDTFKCYGTVSIANAESSDGKLFTSQSLDFIDLSSCMQNSEVTVPTLNGWLLGYPVVYLFGKEHITDAIYNLSTKSIHLFEILVCRNDNSSKGSVQEELMSFSVPYELSMGGRHEPWAEAFLACIQTKWERCRHVWVSLKMEVSGCGPQAMVL